MIAPAAITAIETISTVVGSPSRRSTGIINIPATAPAFTTPSTGSRIVTLVMMRSTEPPLEVIVRSSCVSPRVICCHSDMFYSGLLFNGMMDAYQAAAIGEYRLNLQKGDHVGNSSHHILLLKHICGIVHHFFYCLPFTGSFEGAQRDVGNGFRIVEFQAFFKRRSAIIPIVRSVSLSYSFGVRFTL